MHKWGAGVAVVLAVGVGGCGGDGTGPASDPSLDAAVAALPSIPAVGTDSTLDIGTWNLEWFGSPRNGPAAEGAQLDNVWTVLDAAGVDLWAVQEVSEPAHFEDLIQQLAGYDGLLATNGSVTGHGEFSAVDLQLGMIYRTGAVSIDSARIILSDPGNGFGTRPPLEVHLTAGDGGAPVPLVVIVVHAKAGSDDSDRTLRLTASDSLKAYLDATYPDGRVLVIGDFNDDVDTSITPGESSPYQNFVDDPDYAFPTAALSEAGVSSTVRYPDVIDHHMATDELMADYVTGTAAVVRADEYIGGYGESTSDHYPVVGRYAPPGGAVALPATELTHFELVWTGLAAATVDVYRDGSLLVTTANDGRYLDSVDPATSTVTYRVCEAGAGVCTGDVTVER